MNHSNSLDSLIVHFSTLDMRRDWVRQISQLRHIGCGTYVKTFREVINTWVRCAQVWRQAAIHKRVEELRHLGEKELADVVKSKTDVFHRVGDSHGLEVTAMMDVTVLIVYERVVGGYAIKAMASAPNNIGIQN